jgi:hypothetical protein
MPDVDSSDAYSDDADADSSDSDSSDANDTDISEEDLDLLLGEPDSAVVETHDDEDEVDSDFEEYDEPDRVDENGLVVIDDLPDDEDDEDIEDSASNPEGPASLVNVDQANVARFETSFTDLCRFVVQPEGSPSLVNVDQANVARFETHFMDMCKFLVQCCVDLSAGDFSPLREEQPFCPSAFRFLLQWDPVILARTLLAYIPDNVISVLGNNNLSLDNLLSLSPAAQCQDGGCCYLDLATKSVVGPAKYPTATVGLGAGSNPAANRGPSLLTAL